MRIFAKLIQNHYLHLVTHFNDSGLEQISQEFCEFQHAFYEEEEEFKEAIKLTENDAVSMAFKQLWMPTNNHFLWLQSFVEGKLQHSPIQLQLSQIFELLDGKKVMIGMI